MFTQQSTTDAKPAQKTCKPEKPIVLSPELQSQHPDLVITEISDDQDMSTEDEDEDYLSQIDLQEHLKEFAGTYGVSATKAIINMAIKSLEVRIKAVEKAQSKLKKPTVL